MAVDGSYEPAIPPPHSVKYKKELAERKRVQMWVVDRTGRSDGNQPVQDPKFATRSARWIPATAQGSSVANFHKISCRIAPGIADAVRNREDVTTLSGGSVTGDGRQLWSTSAFGGYVGATPGNRASPHAPSPGCCSYAPSPVENHKIPPACKTRRTQKLN